MKKRWIYLAIGIVALLCIGIYANDQKPVHKASEITPTRIAVSADLHLDLEHKDQDGVNPLTSYNEEIIEALLDDAVYEKADVLLVVGDITNAGHRAQHEALISKLSKAKEAGLPIYVLPGNHDIGDIEPADFATLYGDYGYNDAYSKDAHSLSYVVALGNLHIVMLDTDGYSGLKDDGYVSEATLKWLDKVLKQIRKSGDEVIVCGHYPALMDAYNLAGREELSALLERYEVPLYICGHSHYRYVNTAQKCVELVVEQAISYPCSYAYIYHNKAKEYVYEPHFINVERYAEKSGSSDVNLLDFDNYQETLFRKNCYSIIQEMNAKKHLDEEIVNKAFEFFYEFERVERYRESEVDLDSLVESEGFKAFMQVAEGTNYDWWILNNINGYSKANNGFTISDGVLNID